MKLSNVTSQLTAKALWLVSLAVLVVTVASGPLQLHAQQAVPAAASATAPQAAEGAKPEAAGKEGNQEEEQTEQFRHSSLVKAAAKVLHLEVETTARIFEFINFGIIVLAIGIPLVKLLPKIIRKRSETLRQDIESARKLTEDANTRLGAIEAKLSGLDAEVAGIRAQVEQESLEDEKRIKATLADESARIVAAAEQELAVAAAQARRGLRNFAADLAIEQAARQLVLTPETDRALLAEFTADLAKGGQN